MNVLAAQTMIAQAQDAALQTLRDHAAQADAGERGMTRDMALLADCGLLATLCDTRTAPRAKVTLLRRIGRANLSAGRLAEGHINAQRLITLYGSESQRRRYASAAAGGTIFGVWGADDTPPVQLCDGRTRLSGGKRFASGLGTVGLAVVTARTDAGTQLVVAEVEHQTRADASRWLTSGMRATASGTYDFNGVEADLLGAAGDYEREPHFQGGVWRYAATHVGGLEAIAEAVRCAVGAAKGGASETQLHRVARLATLAHFARLIVEDAAEQVESPGAGKDAVALSLAAREAVEVACLEGISIADRALGTRSFAISTEVERVRRDLGFFLRQADLDGKLRLVGETLCAAALPVGEVWIRP